MTKTFSDLITIVRNVTGRKDTSDPQFTDTVILGYLTDFFSYEAPYELRKFEDLGWYQFNTVANVSDYAINQETIGKAVLRPPAYASGWYMDFTMDPAYFYSLWPETQTYVANRPEYVLFYNNTLTFRAPPDAIYAIKIAALNLNTSTIQAGTTLSQDYVYRYIAYGASMNLLSDYGQVERLGQVKAMFDEYKARVYSRTYDQLGAGRAAPSF